jgi:hypothetical protein
MRQRMWAALVGLGFVTVTMGPAVPFGLAQDKVPELYELLPADREYPIARVCSTGEGLCALPLNHPPGAPCSCRRADGTWVTGVCTH